MERAKAAKIGDMYGQLEIIDEAPPKISGGIKNTCWKVRCHLCGQEKVMMWQHIRRGGACGCMGAAKRKYTHTCEKCGAEFLGGATARYCPACQKEMDDLKGQKGGNDRVKIPVVCCDCGAVFYARTKVAKRCPACRPAAHRKSNAESEKRKRAGTSRKIGSEVICADCGKTFILKTGTQKYCPECVKNHPGQGWASIKKYYRDK